MRHALARLSPEQGEVIDLVYFHGKSVKEAAEVVETAETTVKTRMFYALVPTRYTRGLELTS